MASKGIAFINNKFVPIEKAALSIMDLTVQRGYGITEVFRTYSREPFLLDEHLWRLRHSIRFMDMKDAAAETKIRKIVGQGIKKVRGELLIKILITGGPSEHITPLGRPGLIVYFLPFHGHPKSDYKRGFRMSTYEHLRTMPAAKSTEYFPAILAQVQSEQRGFDEAIFRDNGRILEGTSFNIGLIRGRVLTVPKKDVLQGITMETVLRLAPRLGLRVRRRDLGFVDLKKADEMISTSTIREVLPVVQVDRIKIGSGRPGPYARSLLEELRKYARK